MKQADHFNLKNYKKYKDYINFCRKKMYPTNIVLHNHHIIPKHLWFDTDKSVNNTDNIIQLSVEDHITAHLMLAECYESDTYQHISNLRSARILDKKAIKDKKLLDKISKTYLGSNNPFYGKQHSENVKKTLSEKTKLQCGGIAYEERYGGNAMIEKEKRKQGVKRYWDNIDEKSKNIRCKNISTARKGKGVGSDNGFATKLLVNGNYYGSVKDACKALNTNPYFLYKKNKVEKLNKTK